MGMDEDRGAKCSLPTVDAGLRFWSGHDGFDGAQAILESVRLDVDAL
jgi:hypothetical protein